jgi:hypothetical protein
MKRLVLLLGGALALSCSIAPATAAPSHGSRPLAGANYVYQGNAYGTKVTVGQTVTSGRTAPVVLGCLSAAGQHKTNTAAGINLGALLSTGAINTTADTSAHPVTAKTSAQVDGLNLLQGLVSADVVDSVSATSHQGSVFHTSAAGTTFTSLVVAGVPIGGTIDPNTRIDLPGFGYVVLNEQKSVVHQHSASLTVNAIHIAITEDNVLGIAVGTNLVVAHATSGLGGPVAKALDGFAYGSRLKAGQVLTSGPSFRVTLGCMGTHGKVRSNGGAGVSVPGILETGEIVNTAQGTVRAHRASAETTSTVDSTDLLSGIVDATAIKADAHATATRSGSTFSDSGSSFATLTVAGFPEIGPNSPANTKVDLAGLGTLWIHRVIHRGNSIEVRMIELVVTHDNSLGLPIGADLQIAVAHTSLH